MRFDPNNPPEFVKFDGISFRRMGGARKYYLSQSTTNAGRKGAKGLHVVVWETHNAATVPPDHEINHKNGDVFDFSHDNLECLPKSVHRRLPKANARSAAVLANLDKQRPLASLWHKSNAGRAWHREHATASLALARIARDAAPSRTGGVCVRCGSAFEFRNIRKKFCSNRCCCAALRARGGRKRKAGVQSER